MKRRRIKKGKIAFVSLVPRGANRLPVIFKDDTSFEIQTTVSKYDKVEGLLTAVVYVPEFRDSQGDIASAEVIKQMAHDFVKDGGQIDFRHEGKPLGDKARWVESFIVQKGDPRFEGMTDYTGTVVDPTGGWGMVIKIEDDELKAKAASGELNGVSMAGTAEVVVEAAKEEETGMTLTAKDLQEANKPVIEALQALTKALTPKEPKEPEKVEKGVEDGPPKFEGDCLDPAAILKHANKVRLYHLQKSVDWNDPASVAGFAEQVADLQKSTEKQETPEQRAERICKENAQLKAKLRKLEGASNQGSSGAADSGIEKLDPEDETSCAAMATAILKEAAKAGGYEIKNGTR